MVRRNRRDKYYLAFPIDNFEIDGHGITAHM